MTTHTEKLIQDGLLPCPFCGGEASESVWAGGAAHSVDCDACDFAMGDATETKVRTKWNTRHNLDANALKVAVEAMQLEIALAEIKRITKGETK